MLAENSPACVPCKHCPKQNSQHHKSKKQVDFITLVSFEWNSICGVVCANLKSTSTSAIFHWHQLN
jgi:hypothetical protein